MLHKRSRWYLFMARLLISSTPFYSTGCIASPAHRREDLATEAWFHGTTWNMDMTNEISARIIMNNLNVPGMGDQSGVNMNWRCLE